MAKYIDAEAIESEEMKHYRKTLNSHDARLFVEFMSWIDDIPPADVVERSKIAKTIVELFWDKRIDGDTFKIVLETIQRNI